MNSEILYKPIAYQYRKPQNKKIYKLKDQTISIINAETDWVVESWFKYSPK